MQPSESERLLAESIERLKAEIAETEKLFVDLKWKLAEKKSKLRKLDKMIENKEP